MVNDKVLLTQEGHDELQNELDYLITVKRSEVAEKIKVARGFGDLSENAEYHEAKDEQNAIEQRITELEKSLHNVEIINENNNGKVVTIGCTVKVTDVARKKEMELKIVGTLEADIAKSKISNESPLGVALLNSKEGDIVEVKTKVNTIQYKIDKIIR